MPISHTDQHSGTETHLEPPPVPAHMLEDVERPMPPPNTALALPKWRDLKTRSGQVQVAGGLLMAFAYAYFALHIAGANADSFNVVPGILAVLIPPIALAGVVKLTGLRALGRGFVLGVVVGLLVWLASPLLRLL